MHVQVMRARGGQGFRAALTDYEKMALNKEGLARLARVHPAIDTWLQVRPAPGCTDHAPWLSWDPQVHV